MELLLTDAQFIVDGVELRYVHADDIVAIVRDPEKWIAESASWTAQLIRQHRAAEALEG